MSRKTYAAICGTYCEHCNFLGKNCNGCGKEEGQPFWTVEMPAKICPLYDCCNNQMKIEHCGLCEQFPCKTFIELRDPNMSDAEFQKSLQTRQDALNRRAEIGTDKWLQEMSNSSRS